MSASRASMCRRERDLPGGRVRRSGWLGGAVAVLSLAATMGGCSQGPNPSLAGPTYPERSQAKTLDIQVVRNETEIRLTNTTARSYRSSRLWINRWYSKPIERFDVGQTLKLSLWDFRDEYGEAFQAGGFFATRKPEKLVLAQLESGDEMLGLIVVEAATE